MRSPTGSPSPSPAHARLSSRRRATTTSRRRPFLLGVCLAFLAAGLLAVASRARRGASTAPATWPLALVAPAGFAAQEHLERLAATGSFPAELAMQPGFLAGLALQLPFALLAVLAARWLGRGAEAVGRAIGRAPAYGGRLPAASPGPRERRPATAPGAGIRAQRTRSSPFRLTACARDRGRVPRTKGGPTNARTLRPSSCTSGGACPRCLRRLRRAAGLGSAPTGRDNNGARDRADAARRDGAGRDGPTADRPSRRTETEPAETEPPAATEDRFDVDVLVMVAEGERVGGEGRVEAKKNDRVRIAIQVDEPQEFHLHGYELSRSATPNEPAVFRFNAKLEGIFELESHLSEAVIVNVVVEP